VENFIPLANGASLGDKLPFKAKFIIWKKIKSRAVKRANNYELYFFR
jgi:hypothetical protein